MQTSEKGGLFQIIEKKEMEHKTGAFGGGHLLGAEYKPHPSHAPFYFI